MIAMGFQNMVTGQWWPSLYPGLALAITVFGFALVGSSIEVLADPMKRRALVAELRPRGGSPSPPGPLTLGLLVYIGSAAACSSPRNSSASSW